MEGAAEIAAADSVGIVGVLAVFARGTEAVAVAAGVGTAERVVEAMVVEVVRQLDVQR